MNPLALPKSKIKAAFQSGIRLTTAQGNRLAQTVDFRKIVSRLIDEGMEIRSFWNAKDGRRWKTYYYEAPLPRLGSRMHDVGSARLSLDDVSEIL